MSGTVGPKTQFFRYIIDLPIGQTIIEYQDSDGVNKKLEYDLRLSTQVFISCVTYGTIILNGVLSYATNESCPDNTSCNQDSTITNNGKC